MTTGLLLSHLDLDFNPQIRAVIDAAVATLNDPAVAALDDPAVAEPVLAQEEATVGKEATAMPPPEDTEDDNEIMAFVNSVADGL
jgi:hypothetical protein